MAEEYNYRDELNNALKKRFGGRKGIALKRKTIYPYSVEREYQREVRKYLAEYREELKKCMPEIIGAYNKAISEPRYDGMNYDGLSILEAKINEIMARIKKNIVKKRDVEKLKEMARKYGDRANRFIAKEWRQSIKAALGLNIFEDYYNQGEYKRYLDNWIDANVEQISSIPDENLHMMKDIIYDGYTKGKSITFIKEKIQEKYGVSKRKAVLIARDQIGTLTGQVTQMQQRDAGCDSYVWSTSRDSRVRECHRELDGKVIKWDDPPEMWYRLKNGQKVYTGRRCHPGEDYCCRCVALANIVFEALDLPIDPLSDNYV